MLVTRNTVMAAARATAAVNTVTFSAGRVLVLAIVSDGLPEPAEATYRFRLLDARVGGIVRVPFVPALRVTDNPLRVELPRKARRALAEIRARAEACAPRPAPEGGFVTSGNAPGLPPGADIPPGVGLAPGTGPLSGRRL